MKTYKVERVFEPTEDELVNAEALNLVNVEDPTDYIMVAEDEFIEGEIVTEDSFYVKECNYVDEQGTGTGYFAFKNKVKVMAIEKGNYLYIVKGAKKYLRKCNYAEGNIFEWNSGYARQNQLKANEEKSKVKFILDYT